jgi:hypothetical protein
MVSPDFKALVTILFCDHYVVDIFDLRLLLLLVMLLGTTVVGAYVRWIGAG